MKKIPFVLGLAIFVFVLVCGYSGYLLWQKSEGEVELKLVEKSISDLKKSVLEKENSRVKQAIAAKEVVQELKADLIEWSKVIKKIRRTLPRKDGFPLVDVLSYSASSAKNISMNVKTIAGTEEPYFDVADFIKSFDSSKDFDEGFVSSISSGSDEEGAEILTFLYTLNYVPEVIVTEELPVTR